MRDNQTDAVFDSKEREIVNLLRDLGTAKNVAKAVVFLSKTREATSRAIERGIYLKQSEVSVAINISQVISSRFFYKNWEGSYPSMHPTHWDAFKK